MLNRDALIKMLLEAGRIALFAALSALVVYFGHTLAGMDQSSVYVLIGTGLLKLIDKYIHENENINVNGVAPF